jgi:hypothetical protein
MNKSGSIYYTLNGTVPTISSPKYINPIIISSSKTLKYMAVDLFGNQSPIYTENYIIFKKSVKYVNTKTITMQSTGIPLGWIMIAIIFITTSFIFPKKV